jgi:predicted kinase
MKKTDITVEYLHILCGLPGSGKSTFIQEELLSSYLIDDIFVYSTDMYIDNIAKQLNTTYSDVFDAHIKKATNLMNELLEWAKTNKKVVIWDQTNLSKKKRDAIRRHFPNVTNVVYHVFQVDENTLKERIKSRPGKVIPQRVLYSMKKSFEIPGIDTEETPVIYHGVEMSETS